MALRTSYSDLEGSGYIEFQAHPYQQRCWLPDSLFYTQEQFHPLFARAMAQVLPNYDYYSFFDIPVEDFQRLAPELLSSPPERPRSPKELKEIRFFIQWAEDVFKTEAAIAFVGM